jgi:hypothetical protein
MTHLSRNRALKRHAIQAACLGALGAFALPGAWAQSKPGVQIITVSTSSTETIVRIVVPDPVLETVKTDAGAFERFSAREGGAAVINDSREIGLPELPLTGFSAALPVDGEGATVDIQPEGGIRRLQAKLYPVQPGETNRTGTENDGPPKFVFDQALYLKGVKTPGQSQGEVPVFKGDANINGYRFTPYGYDPGQGLITYYPSYLVTIKHTGGKCFLYDRLKNPKWLSTRQDQGLDAVDQKVEALPLPAFQFTVNKLLANEIRCAPPLQIDPAILGARFLIISHPNFKAAADDLKAHKQALGISTLVVTTSEITGSTAAATDAQIRAWIAKYYNNHLIRPKWVLFMGDAEYVPTHYDQKNSDDSARNAGDIWYGQFLPGATAVTIPPFGIGRMPVDSLAQANTIVSKVKAFELSPPAAPLFGNSFYSNLTFASYFQSTGTTDSRWFVETSEIIRNHLKAKGYNVSRLYTAPSSATPKFYRGGGAVPAELQKPTFAWNATSADVVSKINAGSALVFHRDHGWWDGWGDPAFTTANLGAVSVSGNRFPVVFSVNCASGIFDNETVDLSSNIYGSGYGVGATTINWAEAFLRKPDGALAIIGDMRSSSTVDNNHLSLGLFDAVFPQLLGGYGTGTSIRRLGDILNYAKSYISDVSTGAAGNSHPLNSNGTRPSVEGLRQELNIYNLLGDPTVKLRVSPPTLLSISSVALRGNLALINIKQISKTTILDDEWITAIALDAKTGEEIGRSVVNADGVAQIDLGANKPENIWVRVASTDGAATQAAAVETDTDGDGVPDSRDNCTQVKNPDQKDSDSDGYGDACDADVNNDGLVNSIDVAIVRDAFGTRGTTRADINGDGLVNATDVAIVRKLFATRPGPSAWHTTSR